MKVQRMLYRGALMVAFAFSNACLAETVWIDVRTDLEHRIDSIEGDLRIGYSEIVSEVEQLIPDKNAEIKLYCRSGGRAENAAQALSDAGYTRVESVGGIGNARRIRGTDGVPAS